ncbi:MAG TPA: S-layer protein [Candidatus Acidoferrum sp.]|nr:S-layer protein [Candidatus Acidoferrum sp.]
MKSINTKRIAAVAAGAALLGIGLACAGPVSISNVQIIGSSGQPLVQIVVGSKAAITDGIAAANIAAAIGNLAYTTQGITASVNTTNANNVLKVAVTGTGGVTGLTNAQVYLNESGTAFASGSYTFTALIGSVLNRAIQLGSPTNTKSLQANQNYAFYESNSLTQSPAASPYWAASSVPLQTSVIGSSNGGGVSFSSFTTSSYDNILQVTNAQLPALLNNNGQYGETETLWLTGFPVYNQTGKSFALMDSGGAYQVTFTKPIVMSSGSGGNSINNAAFSFLGQNWTIIGYQVPGGIANRTVGGSIVKTSTTAVATGGSSYIQVASSLSSLKTVYVGQNVSGGGFTVQLTDIGQPNSNGQSPAAINLYHNGALVNVTSVSPNTTASFNVSGTKVFVKVGQTFAGLYAYQKYAKIQLYSSVFTLNNNQQYNKTNDPGWYVNLLWTNTSTNPGNAIQLQSILVYNYTPQTLIPGQHFAIMGNPNAWNLQFIGDNLGNAFDPLVFQTSTATRTYQNFYSGSALATGASGGVQNITEPEQVLTVTSNINNAFSFSGQTGTTVVYDLTPYALLAGNTIAGASAVNVVVTDPGNFINANNQLTVKLVGSNGASATTNSLIFNTPGNAPVTGTIWTTFTNLTAITLQGTQAIPGLTVQVYPFNGVGNSILLAQLVYQNPTIQYQQSGQSTWTQVSGANVIYNQQNGQPTQTFTISNIGLPSGAPVSSTQYFTYSVASNPVPANTAALAYLQFAIFNNTVGVGSQPLFWLNASVGTLGSSPGKRNNMTYISTTGQNLNNAGLGFRTERGSTIAQESSTSVTIDYAENVDQLVFSLAPSSSAAATSTQHQYGPFSPGQSIGGQNGVPGVSANVTVSKISGTPVLGAGSSYSITGLSNLTATPSVSTALVPVWLTNLTTTPLVILDSQANPSSSLILIGSGYVNSISKTLEQSQNISVTPSTQMVQAYGNKIYIAGYTAAQTTAAANEFIQQLYAAAAT